MQKPPFPYANVMGRFLAVASIASIATIGASIGTGCVASVPDETADITEGELRSCPTVTGTPAEAPAGAALFGQVPYAWRRALPDQAEAPYWGSLATFLASARARGPAVFPAEADTFRAFALTPPSRVKVVIIGQDPYLQPGQAHGLAFSVRPPTAPPPSLQNILTELESDIPATHPVAHGSLEAWAKQGVLLINTILTVEQGKPGSHACRGWEQFSDAVLAALSAREGSLAFVLWGSFAQSKARLIDRRHVIITGAHPSPRSADRGFFGSRPFSKVNAALLAQGKAPIDWQLPDAP